MLEQQSDERQLAHQLRLAKSRLSEWAPAQLVHCYATALHHAARIDFGDKLTATRLEQNADIIRSLGSYPYNKEMKKAWATYLNGPFTGDTGVLLKQRSADHVSAAVEHLIRTVLDHSDDFKRIPKRTRAERNKVFGDLARKLREAASQLQDDYDLSEATYELIPSILGRSVISVAERGGARFSKVDHDYPASIVYDMSLGAGPPRNAVAYSQWTKDQKLTVLSHFAADLKLESILESTAQRLLDAQEMPVMIPAPGRKDKGQLPYTIRSTSSLMLDVHAQPFDEAVASFVSAILKLESPLARDQVKPYR